MIKLLFILLIAMNVYAAQRVEPNSFTTLVTVPNVEKELTTSSLVVGELSIIAGSGNVGKVFINSGYVLLPGEMINLSSGYPVSSAAYNLNKFTFKGDTLNDSVTVVYYLPEPN